MQYGMNLLRMAREGVGGQSWYTCHPLYTPGFSHGPTKPRQVKSFQREAVATTTGVVARPRSMPPPRCQWTPAIALGSKEAMCPRWLGLLEVQASWTTTWMRDAVGGLTSRSMVRHKSPQPGYGRVQSQGNSGRGQSMLLCSHVRCPRFGLMPLNKNPDGQCRGSDIGQSKKMWGMKSSNSRTESKLASMGCTSQIAWPYHTHHNCRRRGGVNTRSQQRGTAKRNR